MGSRLDSNITSGLGIRVLRNLLWFCIVLLT